MKKHIPLYFKFGAFLIFGTLQSHADLIASWTTFTSLSGSTPASYNGLSAAPTLTAVSAGGAIASVTSKNLLDYGYSAGHTFNASDTLVTIVLHSLANVSISGLVGIVGVDHPPTKSNIYGEWNLNGTYYQTPDTLIKQGTSTALFETNALGSFTMPANSSLSITFSLNGTPTGVNTNIDFSQFQIEGNISVVPEPINHALFLFGVTLTGLSAGRVYFRSRRIKKAGDLSP